MSSRYLSNSRRAASLGLVVSSLALAGCATPASPPKAVAAPPTVAEAPAASVPAKLLKRKVAIGRFTNETNYGRALLLGDQLDPLGRLCNDNLHDRSATIRMAG